MKKILITSQPMIQLGAKAIQDWIGGDYQIELCKAEQTVSEDYLVKCIGDFDGWIIGDDPATEAVLVAGHQGRLRVLIKWGIGTDNIDLPVARYLGIHVENTPGMFNQEVADIAIGYLIMLSRHLHIIDREVKKGNWYKPMGESLAGKSVGLIGYGNIGRAIKTRLDSMKIKTKIFDPLVFPEMTLSKCCSDTDILIVACALTKSSKAMINSTVLNLMSRGGKVINVSRGPVILEQDLLECLKSGQIGGIALDVYEKEPLDQDHPFISMSNCILGSHNASNTLEAVQRTSQKTLQIMDRFLKGYIAF